MGHSLGHLTPGATQVWSTSSSGIFRVPTAPASTPKVSANLTSLISFPSFSSGGSRPTARSSYSSSSSSSRSSYWASRPPTCLRDYVSYSLNKSKMAKRIRPSSSNDFSVDLDHVNVNVSFSSGLLAAVILLSLTTLSEGTYGCHNLSHLKSKPTLNPTGMVLRTTISFKLSPISSHSKINVTLFHTTLKVQVQPISTSEVLITKILSDILTSHIESSGYTLGDLQELERCLSTYHLSLPFPFLTLFSVIS